MTETEIKQNKTKQMNNKRNLNISFNGQQKQQQQQQHLEVISPPLKIFKILHPALHQKWNNKFWNNANINEMEMRR